MDIIKIKRLNLENFKCHEKLILDLNGDNASIYGDNPTGKTTVYDALTWLLFSKDSHGNGEKNIEIKPLDCEGNVKDHLAVTAVEAVLLVNGEEVTLRRTYKEVWTTKRGSSEASYDGNTSEYYVDGVPVKKFAFADKVGDLVDEDTFRMLTSVSHFADTIAWQDRRSVLFRIAGVMSDSEIMASDERFTLLTDGMGKLTPDDYKKKLLAEKKKYVGAKTEIPARISEVGKTIDDITKIDFDAVRADLAALNAEKERLDAEILAMENDVATEKKRMELREVNLETEKLESENNAYRRLQNGGEQAIEISKKAIANFTRTLESKRYALKGYERSIEEMEEQIAACRDRWMSANRETFTGGTCPTCGQALPAAQLTKARESFEADKRAKLREIEDAASARKAARAQTEEQIAYIKEDIQSLEDDIESAKDRLSKAEAAYTEPADMDGYRERKAALEERAKVISGELANIAESLIDARGAITKELVAVRKAIADKSSILSQESLLGYTKERMARLHEDAKNTAAKLDEIEGMLYLIDEYSRYKTRFVEEGINGMFRLAKFRLFREQANGGVEDRCDVTYDGVPYISLNNGAKINVGIDIINTLSRAFGVSVPLFVDNAESVTRLENFDGQIIRLVVSEFDKE